MKKLMMIAALAMLATASVQAQDKPKHTPEEQAKRLTERMTKDLGLNADQATRVEALNLKYIPQMQAMRQQHKAHDTTAPKDGKGKELREAHDAELKAILTPDQYTKWMAEREAAKEKHKEQHKQDRGDQKQ